MIPQGGPIGQSHVIEEPGKFSVSGVSRMQENLLALTRTLQEQLTAFNRPRTGRGDGDALRP